MARHGQDQDNSHGILNGRRDTSLTQKGKEQARLLGENIKALGLKFDAVFSSPLIRAKETAELVSLIAQTPKPEAIENLMERDFGIMTGQPIASIKEKCAPDILQAEVITYFLSPEGAETFPDLIERGKRLISHIQEKYQSGNILLVTHGDMGKMIYAAYYNLPWKDVLLQFHFGNSELLLLSPNSAASDAHVFKQAQFNH